MPQEDINIILEDITHVPTGTVKNDYDITVLIDKDKKINAAKACMNKLWISNVFNLSFI